MLASLLPLPTRFGVITPSASLFFETYAGRDAALCIALYLLTDGVIAINPIMASWFTDNFIHISDLLEAPLITQLKLNKRQSKF
tara:strand:+ start:56 stop:307 length:252 start_codon:yes stop_codon:yes gene_type:complete